jgi:hypothetical protein
MITRETLEVVQAHFTEIKLYANGKTGGWTMEAFEQEPYKERIFEGVNISDCFHKAREFINK